MGSDNNAGASRFRCTMDLVERKLEGIEPHPPLLQHPKHWGPSMLLAVLRAMFRFQGAVEHFALPHQFGIGSARLPECARNFRQAHFSQWRLGLRCDSSDLMKQGAKVTDGLESQLESHFFGRAVFLLKQPARLVDQ